MFSKRRGLLLVLLCGFSVALFPKDGMALNFPGPAPCDGTLQACIDGAPAGDVIEIATNNRIQGPLTIAKSLTLRPATGFAPLIGNPNPATPDDIQVQDAGIGGGAVTVVFQDLNFDAARLRVSFLEDQFHRFEMIGCHLTHDANSNNDDGVDLGLVRTSSSILLANNFIAAPGRAVSHLTAGAGGSGDIEITLQANLITGTNPANSSNGLDLEVGGAESLVMNFFDNVISRVGSCNCGSNSGMEILTADTAKVVLNANNNTFDNIITAAGINIATIGGTSSLEFNFFNNTVSNADSGGILAVDGTFSGLTFNNGFNNFFNPRPNEGIVEGPGTISVDPLFVNPAGGNYRLQPGSPLINAGINDPLGGLPAVDGDNLPRTAGGTVDIGAYEFSADNDGPGVENPGDEADGTDEPGGGGGCQLRGESSPALQIPWLLWGFSLLLSRLLKKK